MSRGPISKRSAPDIPASLPPSGPAGGDLSGTYPNPTVSGLQTKPIDATAPTAGDLLVFDGTSWTNPPTITDAEHGNRGGGTLHAVATGATAGFMSAADKTNLDAIVAGTVAGSSFFGDGADGLNPAQTGAASNSLIRATSNTTTGNVTPPAGSTMLVLCCTGTLTVAGGTSINVNGLGGAHTNGGAAGGNGTTMAANAGTELASTGTVTGGAAGTAGTSAPTAGGGGGSPGAATTYQGGAGGGGGGGGGKTATAGQAGGAGGQQTASGASFSQFKSDRVQWTPYALASFTNTQAAGVIIGGGGAGGGGGGTGAGTNSGAGGPGGNGGDGGGGLSTNAPTITGTGSLQANGTVGANGTNGGNALGGSNSGGGGGGGSGGGGAGGFAQTRVRTLGGGITITASGGGPGTPGTKGNLDGTGRDGGAGGAGASGAAGVVQTCILG